MFDVIVVGSGAAGVAAARVFKNRKVLLLDVGFTARGSAVPTESMLEKRRTDQDLFLETIGEQFEGLHNLGTRELGSHAMSPKLKGPLMRFVSALPGGHPIDDKSEFAAVLSYAQGGLANAWGAGVLRFGPQDLVGFPLTTADLEPYYQDLTRHIGIAGCVDDLTPFLGDTADLLPPHALSTLSADLLRRYDRCRSFFHRRGLYLGRTRAAILSRDHGNRRKFTSDGHEFFQPNNPAIYHPGYTLAELRKDTRLTYLDGYLVTSFLELPDGVQITARNLSQDSSQTFFCKKLLLAAGAINTVRIVLASSSDFSSELPLLENPTSFVPLVNVRFIGSVPRQQEYCGGELLVMHAGSEKFPEPLQASFYNLYGPLRADLVGELPLAMRSSLAVLRGLLPAMGMLQVFYPDQPQTGNFLKLRPDGSLLFRYRAPQRGLFERHLIGSFFRLGYLSLPMLCRYPQSGSSIHYAGGLPMRAVPQQRYETDLAGRLFGTRSVHIVDAATFPRLPAKNLTFSIMANAMRIANLVDSELH